MEDLYTVKEVAAKLKVTERAVLDWMRAGKLRAAKVGKAWRIKESDLEAFFAAGLPHDESARRQGDGGKKGRRDREGERHT